MSSVSAISYNPSERNGPKEVTEQIPDITKKQRGVKDQRRWTRRDYNNTKQQQHTEKDVHGMVNTFATISATAS